MDPSTVRMSTTTRRYRACPIVTGAAPTSSTFKAKNQPVVSAVELTASDAIAPRIARSTTSVANAEQPATAACRDECCEERDAFERHGQDASPLLWRIRRHHHVGGDEQQQY